MPELPEVETIKRQLGEVLVGGEIVMVEVLREKCFQGDEKELFSKVIESVQRKAKMIIFRFINWDKVLAVHLKMTGQLVWLGPPAVKRLRRAGPPNRRAGGHPTADWVGELPSKHTRVIISFADRGKLFFNDLRVFGWMKILDIEHFKLYIDKLPPDVIDDEFKLS